LITGNKQYFFEFFNQKILPQNPYNYPTIQI